MGRLATHSLEELKSSSFCARRSHTVAAELLVNSGWSSTLSSSQYLERSYRVQQGRSRSVVVCLSSIVLAVPSLLNV